VSAGGIPIAGSWHAAARRIHAKETEMIKTVFAASIMALALVACNKPGDNPSTSSSATPSTSSSDSGGSAAGLSQLGGNTKR
jgi:hypothetical protein